ncbi:MAG TPA: hypothetical protein VLN59_01345 [Burkholderiales bacterium]|nr:hypothetical protein [Burkholderiales bacterium]
MTAKNQERIFISLGTAMVAWLVWIASAPITGDVFDNSYTHYPAHFAAFAALAITWCLGLPRASVAVLAVPLVAFGFVHEAYEVVGHVHGFELYDALTDAAGAVAGIGCARALLRRRSSRLPA